MVSEADGTIGAQRANWTTQGPGTVGRRETQASVTSPFMSFSSHCLIQGCLQLRVLSICTDFTLYENRTISQEILLNHELTFLYCFLPLRRASSGYSNSLPSKYLSSFELWSLFQFYKSMNLRLVLGLLKSHISEEILKGP